ALNRTRIISVDRGFERWQAMQASATPLGDDLVRVSLGSKPPDLLWDSERNEDWNLRTLTLMSRAGMIELQNEPAAPSPANDDERSTKQHAPSQAVIRLVHGHLADQKEWEGQVREARRRTHGADVESLRLMQSALRGTVDLAEVFQSAYLIDLQERGSMPRIS